jgi:autoinducer 2 (AI-2) kinase
VTAAVREVVDLVGADRIDAVAPTSMREGFVLIDAAGHELWACPNTDGRARQEAAELVGEGAADRIYRVSGDWVSITAPARLRWLRRHRPDVLEHAATLLMLSDWVAWRLCGIARTEPTCGSSSAMFDLATRSWSAELADLVGIDTAILPPVVEPGSAIGAVTAAAAAGTGLREGTPVVAGGADTQLALHALAAPAGRPTVVAGTFWQTTAVTRQALIDPDRRLRTLCHVEPGTWMIEGIGFLHGLAMRWARDGLLPGRGGADAYDLMEAEAARVPRGSGGMLAMVSAPMQADAWHQPVPGFLGIDLGDPGTTGRAGMFRALEEAAAYVVAEHLGVLDELGAVEPGELVLTGGSSAGRLQRAIVAEVTGRILARSPHPEATSYGAARLAAHAIGAELPALRIADDRVEPSAEAVAEYAAHRSRWRRAMTAMLRADTGLDPLFDPPGAIRPPHPLLETTDA